MNYKERDNDSKKGKKSYQERLQEELDAQLEIDSYLSGEEEEEDDDRDSYEPAPYNNSY